MAFNRYPLGRDCKPVLLPFNALTDYGAHEIRGPVPTGAPFDGSPFERIVRRGDPRTKHPKRRRRAHVFDRMMAMKPAKPFDGSPFQNIIQKTQDYYQVRMDPLSMEDYTNITNQENLDKHQATHTAIHSGLTFLPSIIKKMKAHDVKIAAGQAARGSSPDYTPAEKAYIRSIGRKTPEQMIEMLAQLQRMQIEQATLARQADTATGETQTAPASGIPETTEPVGEPVGDTVGDAAGDPPMDEGEFPDVPGVDIPAPPEVSPEWEGLLAAVEASLADPELRELLDEDIDVGTLARDAARSDALEVSPPPVTDEEIAVTVKDIVENTIARIEFLDALTELGAATVDEMVDEGVVDRDEIEEIVDRVEPRLEASAMAEGPVTRSATSEQIENIAKDLVDSALRDVLHELRVGEPDVVPDIPEEEVEFEGDLKEPSDFVKAFMAKAAALPVSFARVPGEGWKVVARGEGPKYYIVDHDALGAWKRGKKNPETGKKMTFKMALEELEGLLRDEGYDVDNVVNKTDARFRDPWKTVLPAQLARKAGAQKLMVPEIPNQQLVYLAR
jgi:hypothetical protein